MTQDSVAYTGRTKYDDRVADRYRHRAERRRGRENAVLCEILDEVGLQGTVLDAPCGVGRIIELVGSRVPSYLGIDLSPAMLVLTAERLRDVVAAGTETAPPAQLLRGDLERLPLADRSSDVTLCLRFLHHLPADIRERVVQELSRVTGRVLVLTYFHPFAMHFVSRKVKEVVLRRKSPRYSNTLQWLVRRLEGRGFRLRASRSTGFLRETRYAVFER